MKMITEKWYGTDINRPRRRHRQIYKLTEI